MHTLVPRHPATEPYPIITYTFVLRRMPLPYIVGIVVPLVLTTLAGFGTFLVNPDSGERLGLGVTVILATAAIFIVAADDIPRTRDWTKLVLLYSLSFIGSFLSVLTSFVVVSLYNVKDRSDGLMAEGNLLTAFVKADADGSGELDREELLRMVKILGLDQKKIDKMNEIVQMNAVDCVNFELWYDIVGEIAEVDYLATHHSPLIGMLMKPFIRYERQKRRDVVVRRAEVAFAEGKLQRKTAIRSDRSQLHRHSPGRLRSSVLGRSPSSTSRRISTSSRDDAPNHSSVIDDTTEPTSPIGEARSAMVHPVEGDGSDLDKDDNFRNQDAFGVNNSSNEEMKATDGSAVTLISEHEMTDPTQKIGRRIAAYIDMLFLLVLVPIYSIVALSLFFEYKTVPEFAGTILKHTAPDGLVTESCCFGSRWVGGKGWDHSLETGV